jgi:hypothetical protein
LNESCFRGERAVVLNNIQRGAVVPPDLADQIGPGRPAPAQIAAADGPALVALLCDLHAYATERLHLSNRQWYDLIDQASDQFTAGFCAALAAQANDQRRQGAGGNGGAR